MPLIVEFYWLDAEKRPMLRPSFAGGDARWLNLAMTINTAAFQGSMPFGLPWGFAFSARIHGAQHGASGS